MIWCIILLAVHFFPVARIGITALVIVSFDLDRVKLSLITAHLNFSVAKSTSTSTSPYVVTLLRHQGVAKHYLVLETIIFSIYSTFVRVMSYMVRGHIRWNHNPNNRHQIFSLLVVDSYTKLPEILKYKRLTTSVAINFLHKIFVRFGVSDSIISDNGTQFTYSVFKFFGGSLQI